jgi:hypothetical protein
VTLQRTLDFAFGRSFIGASKDGRHNHMKSEGTAQGECITTAPISTSSWARWPSQLNRYTNCVVTVCTYVKGRPRDYTQCRMGRLAKADGLTLKGVGDRLRVV